MNTPLKTIGTTLILWIAPFAFAQDQPQMAAGPSFGTLGAGAEVAFRISPKWSVRGLVGAGVFDLEDVTIDDVDYDIDARNVAGLVTADYYPWERSFRIAAGVMFTGGNSDLELGSGPSLLRIGGGEYAREAVREITGEVENTAVAPYIGIGWGNQFRGGRWGVGFDLGFGYVGEPDVVLTGELEPGADPNEVAQFEEDLKLEAKQIEEDIPEIFVVAQLTISFRF